MLTEMQTNNKTTKYKLPWYLRAKMKLKEKLMLELDAGGSLDSSWSELDHQAQSPSKG